MSLFMHGLAYSGEQWASAVSHFDRNDELITCLSGSHEIQLLRQAASLLSIGPGTGELDEKLLSTLFTSVKTYHAVEVKCDLLNMTQDKIDQLPNVKGIYFGGSVEEYGGPSQKVDAVLWSNCLYGLQDSADHTLSRVYDWLNPGGVIVVVTAVDGLRKIIESSGLELPSVDIDFKESVQRRGYPCSEYLSGHTLSYPWSDTDSVRSLADIHCRRKLTDQELWDYVASIKRYNKARGNDPESETVRTYQNVWLIRKPI